MTKYHTMKAKRKHTGKVIIIIIIIIIVIIISSSSSSSIFSLTPVPVEFYSKK